MLLPKMPDSELQHHSRAAQPWPHSDPCRDRSFSFGRFALMAALFLCMTVGSLPLFFLLMKAPYGLQAASAIVYTIFAVFFTFARTGSRIGKDLPPYIFTCPAVQPQLSRLLWRHLGFLVVLFALQTAVLAARPNLPAWWNIADRKGTSLFDLALILLCFGLGYAQVFTNRSLLDRAHREFSAETARL
jgi:Ca2+/Na+ antiporter